MKRTAYQFPWSDGNRFHLLIDGIEFFPAMLNAIAQAQHFIALEMYLFESGQVATRMIDSLLAAAQRGVVIHIVLDHYGSLALLDTDRARLREAGVALYFYNPLKIARWRRSFYRDHRKLLIVDGGLAFVGGAGFTDAFDSQTTPDAWRETMVEIHGPVVRHWCALFAQVWQRLAGTELRYTEMPTPPMGKQRGRVVSNQPRGPWEVTRSALKNILEAQRCVWLATAYFVPSWKLRRALREAACAGIDVRLLLPGPLSDHPGVRHAGQRHYGGLLRNQVRIFEYQARFMHQKILLCDSVASIGSSNMDRWGQRWNLEANQEIANLEFAHEVTTQLQADFTHAEEITYHAWRTRSWSRRLLELFWGHVDRMLQRLER